MKKRKKQSAILALFVAVCMAITFIPGTVSAGNPTQAEQTAAAQTISQTQASGQATTASTTQAATQATTAAQATEPTEPTAATPTAGETVTTPQAEQTETQATGTPTEPTKTNETGEDPSTPATQPTEKSGTDKYNSSLSFPTDDTTDTYYGGEIITIYNNVSVTGNETVLDEGSYTVISLPKDEFEKPQESGVSTSFEGFNGLEIKETDTEYQIITKYKTLHGGYIAGTPVRVSLMSRQTVNNSEHQITQRFFDKDGNELTAPYTLTVKGKAQIESLYNSYSSASRLTGTTTPISIDSNYVIKAGSYLTYSLNYYSTTYAYNDPRDRRISVTVPEGTTIKEGNGWTLDPADPTGRHYYKDITRDELSREGTKLELNLSGIDMSEYDKETKTKRFQVDWSLSPVVNGVVQTDLGPSTGYYYYDFYILKPGSETASQNVGTHFYNKTINAQYQPVDGDTSTGWQNYTYLSYNKDLLNTQRIRYSQQDLSSYSINSPQDDPESRSLSINFSQLAVSPYTTPSELRIMLVGVSAENATKLTQMLQGTKAYGVTADGSKVPITDNVPIVTYDSYTSSHTADGWQSFSGGENYTKIYFEFPDTLKFDGQDEINALYQAVWTDVIADIKENAYTELKDKIDSAQTPELSAQYNYATVNVTGTFADKSGEAVSGHTTSASDYVKDTFRMQYETITGYNSISITNGSQFFVNDTIDTDLSYVQNRYGNFQGATTPSNLNIYYLVPDGLEPVEDPDTFSSIEVVRGYKDGWNLVVAKPKTTTIPATDGSVNGSAQNRYQLSFTATSRLPIGTYTIYSAMSIDNNKVGVDKKGQQYGIVQFNTPSGLWETITKDAANRPDDNTKFTDLGSRTFTVYPPRVFSFYKQVKLSTESDEKYASSIGKKATIGTQVDYRWMFKNNSVSDIRNLEVIDVLPYAGDKTIVPNDDGEYSDRGSKFSTPLISVEDNEKFDFYYSTDEVKGTVEENAAANWSTSVPDMSKVTMIKAVLKSGQSIVSGEDAYIVTHNVVEDNDKIGDGDKAYNSFAVSLNNGNSWDEGLKAEVSVNYPKRDVKIKKVDFSDPNETLYGAVFSLYEEGTGENDTDRLVRENITTNHEGIATMADLAVGKEYYLLETTAPEGYEKSDEKIKFTVLSTDEDADQTITVANDVPRTSFDITKTWAGIDAADVDVDEILVHILANGEDTGTTVTLTKADNWETSATNLLKYDENGDEIQYTISEEPVDGYTTDITGDMENGFVITNTKEATPQEPVISFDITKKWAGVAEADVDVDKVTVHILANGKDTGKTVDITKADGWKTTISELAKLDENGSEIQYTISEDPVDGYTSAIAGDMTSGFVVTNTKKEEKPGSGDSKNPVGPVVDNPKSTTNAPDTTTTTTTQPESTVKSIAPQTGYRSPIGLYVGILAVAALAIVLVFARKHKKG